MLLCADGLDCGFPFVPSCSLHSHFAEMQDNYLPQNIVVAIQQTFEKIVSDIAFKNRNIIFLLNFEFSKSVSCQHQNDPAYSVFLSVVNFVNKH